MPTVSIRNGLLFQGTFHNETVGIWYLKMSALRIGSICIRHPRPVLFENNWLGTWHPVFEAA